jgi:hypothetical protein
LAAAVAAGAAAADAPGARVDGQVAAAAEVLLPHLQNPLGISDGRQPTAQALAVDPQHQQVFIGERHVALLCALVALAPINGLSCTVAALRMLRHSATTRLLYTGKWPKT